MLIGEYQHKMDSKRRLPLPAKLRAQLGAKVILTRGLEGCLFVYPVAAWETFARKLNELPLSKASGRNFGRFIFSGASEIELDNLGRILVPEYLKQHAGLKKDVMVVGTGERLELWDREHWKAYEVSVAKEAESHAETLTEYGL